MRMWDLWLTLSLLTAAMIFGGFCVGRKYEKQFWIRYYTEEMNKVCLECAGIK